MFGARGTGKSWLLSQLFSAREAHFIDLLDPTLSDRLLAYPGEFNEILNALDGKKDWIVIDEIQKVPKLLDLVHHSISKKRFHFALTGSSARKLKRGAANLLAGRANIFYLYPLTYSELGPSFDLDAVLSFGSLPDSVVSSSDLDRTRYLKSYVQTYIKEEIVSEQIVRNLPPFRRFLDVAAQMNGEIISYSNIAKDIGSDAKTVSNYFEIIEDTLLGFRLPAHDRSLRRQQKKAPKFYFFDNGIVRVLTNQIEYRAVPKTSEFGNLFESWLINEAHRILTYKEKQFKLSYVRVSDRIEVDLLIERSRMQDIACEIKSTDHVDERHTTGFAALGRDASNFRCIVVSNDKLAKRINGVECIHWSTWLNELATD
jgi:predicted AAA+ superfamily ATPase